MTTQKEKHLDLLFSHWRAQWRRTYLSKRPSEGACFTAGLLSRLLPCLRCWSTYSKSVVRRFCLYICLLGRPQHKDPGPCSFRWHVQCHLLVRLTDNHVWIPTLWCVHLLRSSGGSCTVCSLEHYFRGWKMTSQICLTIVTKCCNAHLAMNKHVYSIFGLHSCMCLQSFCLSACKDVFPSESPDDCLKSTAAHLLYLTAAHHKLMNFHVCAQKSSSCSCAQKSSLCSCVIMFMCVQEPC